MKNMFNTIESHLNYRSVIDYKSPLLNGSHCINSTLKINSGGYTHVGKDYKVYGRHRVSYELAYGALEDGMQAQHLCNNKICINPDHLTSGRHKENNAYTAACGRSCKGTKNARSKLVDYDIRRVRNDFATGLFTKAELAREYGINPSSMGDILNNKTWKHVN